MSLSELLTIDPSEFTQKRAEHAVTVYVTSIDGANSEVINVLAPQGMAFWSFGVFDVQVQRMNMFLEDVQSIALRYIEEAMSSLHASRKSVNTYELLAPFCRRQGPKYYPYSTVDSAIPYWWFAQRHFTCACPAGESASYIEYFSQQQRQIGKDCYIEASDDVILVDVSQYAANLDYIYLTKYVGRFSAAERIIAEAALSREKFLETADQSVLRVIGRSGGPNLGLVEELSAYQDAERVRAILRLRADLALRFLTLIDLERMKSEIGNFWNLSDSERALKNIESHLEQFPVVSSSF